MQKKQDSGLSCFMIADKIFIAVKQWLKDRLKLEISEEKSKVVNLKKHYSEFLGFKLKAVRKGKKFVVRSHMTDKAVKRVTENLKKQIREISHGKTKNDEILQIKQYNSMVMGIHNYYRYATNVSLDCMFGEGTDFRTYGNSRHKRYIRIVCNRS